MNIFDLFGALEDELNKKKPLGRSDNGEALRMLAALKSAVRGELDAALKISAARETILKNADEAARNIVGGANKQAAVMLSESEYVAAANAKADEILKATAVKQGEIMRNFALFLDAKLYECEKALLSMAEEIKADRAKLFPQ